MEAMDGMDLADQGAEIHRRAQEAAMLAMRYLMTLGARTIRGMPVRTKVFGLTSRIPQACVWVMICEY
jgi:hypothetical protein